MSPTKKYDYPDDLFDDTRMSFGEHIEELRMRMLRALAGLGICLVIGFIIDGLTDMMGLRDYGVGKVALKYITQPVESQVRDFYNRRQEEALKVKFEEFQKNPDYDLIARAKQKLASGSTLGQLTDDERLALSTQMEEMPVRIPVESLTQAFDLKVKDPSITHIEARMQVYPAFIHNLGSKGETLLGTRQYLTTLSIQEAFVVYFKVSLLCGIVISCPWLFWQFWAFVGAGLYPHEKRYVYIYMPFSIGLFLAGVFLCQFFVLPGAVRALLLFNNWIGLDPDLRLNEWLSFAIILPLVFGVSFQTPLIMLFLTKVGMFTAEDFLSKWRYAVMVLALFSALLTPTPDAVTMLYLFLPMFGLYMLGIGLCWLMPPEPSEFDVPDSDEVAV